MPWRRVIIVLLATPIAVIAGFLGYIAFLGRDSSVPSVCRGEVNGGSLERGRRLPFSGENYRAYSLMGFALGRTFVHSSVRNAMHGAYNDVARQRPELRFIYAETGWPWGGRFAPHASHRNGTAVDFHVPVRDGNGRVAELPTTIGNHLGYEIEFDKQGWFGDLRLDFEAMALHLLALDQAARQEGIGIKRVIFDVDLQPLLFATQVGQRLKGRVTFNARQATTRHDEHYHVDFDIPCRTMPTT